MKNFWLLGIGLIVGTLTGNIVYVKLIDWVIFYMVCVLLGLIIRVIYDAFYDSKIKRRRKR